MNIKYLTNEAPYSDEKEQLMTLLLEKEGLNIPQPHAITPREKAEDLRLSFAQERLWFIDQFEPDNSIYNIPVAYRIKGPLNIAELEQSLGEIVQRHEALRTTFASVDGKPVQVIAPDLNFTLPVVDLGKLPGIEREAETQRLATEVAQRPFDLAKGPLLRVKLLRLTEVEHVLLLTMHHIVSDAWSLDVFMRELAVHYEALSRRKPSPLSELPIQYADFAVWQRRWLQNEVLDSQLSYWKQQLRGKLPVLQFPTDRPRPAILTYRGAHQSLVLPKTLTESLKALSQREGVTLFMTLLAAFNTLLFRYTGKEDIIVGSPISNRNRVEIEELIGFFVNTLVMRTDLSGNLSFRELLGRVSEVAFKAYENQDLPFEKLVEKIQPERDLSRTPLFQVMFVFQNTPSPALELLDLTIASLKIDSKTAKFELTLDMRELPEGLRGSMEYNTDLFESATITRMLGHFQTLLEGIVADPHQRVSDVQILTDVERRQLLVDWNDTKTNYPDDRCVHQLFEQQVEQSPDAVAVVYGDEQLTYRELNTRANQLAHYLKSFGVGPEVLIGIYLERSLEMVVGVLGILKAGAAYVPLDPVYPQARLALLLDDIAQATPTDKPIVITQPELAENLPFQAVNTVCLNNDQPKISKFPDTNPLPCKTAHDTAYVLYTSGSTGTPKGVCCHHQGVINLLSDFENRQGIRPGDSCSWFTSISFDVSVYEIFSALLYGGKLYIVPEEMRADRDHFIAWLAEHQIQNAYVPPFMVAKLADESQQPLSGLALRRLLVGVEPIPEPLLATISKNVPGLRIINGYGPTEATICATLYNVPASLAPKRNTPIGRAVQNMQIYLLDPYGQLVPLGVPGEIYIGGVGVARGYLNRPDLTSERFIADPFNPQTETRLYKTGDMARYLPDGNIEFLGRIDHQVKIRGFRIELGEIESVLGRHPAVDEAVVIAREDVPGDKRLVAYVVPSNEPPPTFSEMRSLLKEKLPDYMIPTALVFLDLLPLTPNGKIDRRVLPTPEQSRSQLETKFVAPRTSIEEAVAGIWCEVLGLEKVGMRDNFFDLGGHSLLMIRIHRKLQKIIEEDIPMITLFQYPTIGSLCRYLRREAIEQTSFEQIYDRAERQLKAIHQQKEMRIVRRSFNG